MHKVKYMLMSLLMVVKSTSVSKIYSTYYLITLFLTLLDLESILVESPFHIGYRSESSHLLAIVNKPRNHHAHLGQGFAIPLCTQFKGSGIVAPKISSGHSGISAHRVSHQGSHGHFMMSTLLGSMAIMPK